MNTLICCQNPNYEDHFHLGFTAVIVGKKYQVVQTQFPSAKKLRQQVKRTYNRQQTDNNLKNT